MLCADSMPRSENAALQEGECRFDGVRVNIAFDVNLEPVSNGFVTPFFPQSLRRAAIGVEVIGEKNVHILTDIFVDELLQRAALYILRMEEAKIAAALTDADDDLFVGQPVFFSDGFSADISLIHFDFAAEHRPIGLHHSCADSMAEIPCRLVANSERALNLASGDSFFRFAEEQRSREPFKEFEMRVIEDGARRHRELIVAALAIEKLFLGFEFDGFHLASWAAHAFGPAQPDEQFSTLFFGREHGVYVN